MGAPAIHQQMSLSDRPSSNLCDLLKFRNGDVARVAGRSAAGTVTLATVLEAEKNASSSSSATTAAGRTLLDVIREEEESNAGGSSRWRDLTDRLRIRPPTPERERSETATIRVSLMTLMEMREREEEGEEEIGRADVTAATEVDDDGDADVVASHVCCVCIVRKKGAALIPCGHTFCRICSRELLVRRGDCPLCNATIQQVLQIF